MTHFKQFQQASSIKLSACVFFVSLALASCGGGGGGGVSEAASLDQTNAPATTAKESSSTNSSTSDNGTLIISEVATNYFSNDVAWVEIYNPSANTVSLSSYTLRSSSINPSTGALSYAPATFALPAVDVPARGHLVVAARVSNGLKDHGQMVYVRNGSIVPFWNSSGSVELVADGVTADFVRFGSSLAAPLTPSAWNSANVAALPSGPNEHGKAIVRLAKTGVADTNTAADWTLVNFATPAGDNDVPAGVVDSDQDGIPDSAKLAGGTFGGIDLHAMGARPGRRDIFIEIDYMAGLDAALTPRREALQKLVDAFAGKGIALHLDTGKLYSPGFDPAQFNLGGGNSLAFAKCIDLADSSEARQGCASFYDYKSTNFDVRRKQVFHYAIFANSQNLDGSGGSSGVAEVYGNDLIVTLGGNGLNTTTSSNRNLLINVQASTLMHELGHNLGLLHGGNENINYKPNHYSIMNYMYQFGGLSATPDSINAAERYYLTNGMKGKTYCNLVENSPCSGSFRISFSNGTGRNLDENRLFEADNIGYGSTAGAHADWNNDGLFNAGSYAWNLNPQQDTTFSILRDYNEWANLKIVFARGFSGNNSGDVLAIENSRHPRSNPMNNRPTRKIVEHELPEHVQLMLRDSQHHHRSVSLDELNAHDHEQHQR